VRARAVLLGGRLALTKAQIEAKITAIDDALDNLITHKSYMMDTGQGSQRVTRQSIPELISLREYYETKLERLTHSGITSLRFQRY